nr:cobalamin biosynthesis protein [Azospirillum sp. SYSU D00513]
MGSLPLLLTALAVDAAVGDRLGRFLPDPAALAGRAAAWGDRRLNRIERGPSARTLRGALLVLAILLAAAALGALVGWIGDHGRGWALELLLLLSVLRGREAWNRIRAVRRALEAGGLSAGQEAVGPLTRRHAFSLDAHGVARAAVEQAGRAFVRRIAGPVFGYLLLGMPGLLVWAASAGVDAAIGSPGVRHGGFGRAAARLDDALYAVPARLAGLLLALAGAFVGPGGPLGAVAGALRTVARDARKHASFNMGWPAAALAGGLGLALGGPHRDGGVTITEPWIGGGRARATPADIGRALAMAALAELLLVGGIALSMAVIAGL